MILAIDNQGDIAIYGGPVSSFFETQVAVDQRMNDNQWESKANANQLPSHPQFANAYWSN
jgi:hypothetical protein